MYFPYFVAECQLKQLALLLCIRESSVRIAAQRQIVLTERFHGFPQLMYEKPTIVF
jgi:hypothetical protein